MSNERALQKQRMILCEILLLRLKQSPEFHDLLYTSLNGAFSKSYFSKHSTFKLEVEDLLVHYLEQEDYERCAVIKQYLEEHFNELD